jgi:rhodanese-related sulfurtransferase
VYRERSRGRVLVGVFHEHVVFVCAAGVRSQLAAQLAKSTGSLTRALNLTGGTRAWAKDGFALEVPAVRAAS